MIDRADLYDHDGPPPTERVDATPDDARRLAQAIVNQAVEDLASWAAELRADVEEWIDSLDDEAGTLTWCAWVLGHADDELLIREVRERAHGLRLRRYAHRREIEATHNPGQMEMPL